MATYRNNTGVKITRGNLEQVRRSLELLASVEILVGFPEDTTARDEDPNDDPDSRGITNAALGYIHDNGSPEANIPARPFMVPAMQEAEKDVEKGLSGAMRQAMRGDAHTMEQALIATGLKVKLAIQNKINEGIPPPLSDRTLQKRARRGKNSSIARAAQMELDRRGKGYDPLMVLAKPLIETAQMRNAVNFVIRAKSKRRR